MHFPPIEILRAVPESRFERIALCSYPQHHTLVHRKPRARARNRQCLPFHDNWTSHLPGPHALVLNEIDYESETHQQVDLSFRGLCLNPKILVPQAVNNLSPRPFDAPDRYYPLGEEMVFWYRNGQCTPLRHRDGRLVGDRWLLCYPKGAHVHLEPSVRAVLRVACEAIVIAERNRPGRYLSWTSQVDGCGYSIVA